MSYTAFSAKTGLGFAVGFFCLGLLGLASGVVSSQEPLPKDIANIVSSSTPNTVWLEELTFAEVKNLQTGGFLAVIIPTGGTEQNGFHMVLGKHNYVVRHTAEKIARTVGKTLIAPVLPYVPEGDISPPTGHMAFAGTLTLPDVVFEKVLEHTARSLHAHGFKNIFLLGDSGGNQDGQERVAKRLNAEWARLDVRVHHVSAYYAANGQKKMLKSQGETFKTMGFHAGMLDTSELLSVHPAGVRTEVLNKLGELPKGFSRSGYTGQPNRASEKLGKTLLALKVQAAAVQMKHQLRAKSANANKPGK